ncbi:MAG: translocation/assembly module TamB domain-containing protein [Candidatus Omnitrophica bacterium]|nr:translocation/assembly module TamB domain-containing protein [Candidatus Omnitrophota bacterium]
MLARRLLLAMVLFFIFIAFMAYFLIFTPQGARLITGKIIPGVIGAKKIEFRKLDGSIFNKATFEDLRIEGLKYLPDESVVAIRRLELSLPFPFMQGLQAQMHNGKILLPHSQPIFMRGGLKGGELDLNLYAKDIDLKNISGLFPGSNILNKISGKSGVLDIYIKGALSKPVFTGTFKIGSIIHNGFSLLNCPGSFTLDLARTGNEIKLKGEVRIQEGLIHGPNAVVITMDNSRVLFSGDPLTPEFDLKGNSKIGKVRINIVLRGTPDKPELILTSRPPLPQERLLIMLVTGKGWSGLESAVTKGAISADLASDFIDFFVLGGSAGKIAQGLGISDISVKLDEHKTGIGITKEVYENISVEAQKELKQGNKTGAAQGDQETNDNVMLKFRKEF